jgi:hypothetical protein
MKSNPWLICVLTYLVSRLYSLYSNLHLEGQLEQDQVYPDNAAHVVDTGAVFALKLLASRFVQYKSIRCWT